MTTITSHLIENNDGLEIIPRELKLLYWKFSFVIFSVFQRDYCREKVFKRLFLYKKLNFVVKLSFF